ncbi:hypothetical protein [Vibrio sp. RE88]|uniref:hypothetical protein n=1 Tax=Vibrio sp. RE88 TaxID=2607610 RepID=UPI001493854F|nr:hypothetical protein [Vibrio sp. RE88]NOH64489.1 hypothetical protein [Vibrio sp. RE88]
MRPTKENLTALVGKNIEMDIRLSCRPESSENGYLEKQYGVTLLERDGKVVLTRDDSSVDAGVWVPYAETKAVVGRYTGSGVGWLASGPFSGCEMAIGVDKDQNRVFAAHIAKQSGSTAPADYRKFRTDAKASEFYWNRIPMPFEDKFSCAYVFVICSTDGIISMNSLEVEVTSMGGSNGKVLSVRTFK